MVAVSVDNSDSSDSIDSILLECDVLANSVGSN